MSSIYNGNIKISIFGESHGAAIGAVLDNLPAGEKINFDELNWQMQRRAPGYDKTSTERKESDIPKIISGIRNGYTTGAPICAIIENKNVVSDDYRALEKLLRPGHADYTAGVKYNGFNDARGGGHLSGRTTAALNFCGAVCRQILARSGVIIGAHVYSVFDVFDDRFDVEIPDNFCNLRNGTDHENGLSCLLRDKQRLKLLGAVYERLNYDIQYDGPGRLIFWLKDGFAKGDTIDLSASQVLDESSSSKADRADKARIEAKRLGQEIRNSKSDNVILASSIFDKMDHLPRVTKGTEFLEYLQMKEGSIICQCFGLTPELIGLGDVSGNVSMERIIDNAMTNTIVPMRERFATQISPMLSEKLGVPKVYFDKYELKEQQDKSAKTYKLALSVTQIVGAIVNGGEQLDKSTKNHMMESLVRMMDSIEKTL